MKRSCKHGFRLMTLAVATALVATASPAGAGILEDLGIDLGRIFGSGKSSDSAGLAERILQQELQKRVGPAKRYDVRVAGAGGNAAQGRLGRVDVTGFDVQTNDGLVIPELGLKLEDVKLGLSARSLLSIANGSFSAALGEAAVTRYVQKRAGVGVRDVKVAFRDGQIRVNATPELLGFGIPAEVAGKPVLQGSRAIDFQASRVVVFGVDLPRFAVDTLESKVNPVVDLSGLKLPVRIAGVKVQGDRLVAEGVALFGK